MYCENSSEIVTNVETVAILVYMRSTRIKNKSIKKVSNVKMGNDKINYNNRQLE